MQHLAFRAGLRCQQARQIPKAGTILEELEEPLESSGGHQVLGASPKPAITLGPLELLHEVLDDIKNDHRAYWFLALWTLRSLLTAACGKSMPTPLAPYQSSPFVLSPGPWLS